MRFPWTDKVELAMCGMMALCCSVALYSCGRTAKTRDLEANTASQQAAAAQAKAVAAAQAKAQAANNRTITDPNGDMMKANIQKQQELEDAKNKTNATVVAPKTSPSATPSTTPPATPAVKPPMSAGQSNLVSGPAGPQGPQGSQGPAGPPGAAGQGGTTITGGLVTPASQTGSVSGAVAGAVGGAVAPSKESAALAGAPDVMSLLLPGGRKDELWVGCFTPTGASAGTQVKLQINQTSANSFTFSRTLSPAPQGTTCPSVPTAPVQRDISGTIEVAQTVAASGNTFSYDIDFQLGPTPVGGGTPQGQKIHEFIQIQQGKPEVLTFAPEVQPGATAPKSVENGVALTAQQ